MSVARFSPLPSTIHPVQIPSEGQSLDRLPSELIGLICYWVHADRKTVNGVFIEQIERPDGWRDLGHHTQFSRTLARLSLASKRYRQIVLPYLYSYITVGQYDETQLPLFIYTLCCNPDLRPLVKKIEIEGFPRALIIDAETAEAPFTDAAAELSLTSSKPWNFKRDSQKRIKLWEFSDSYTRMIILLFLLTPNMENLDKLFPGQIYFGNSTAAYLSKNKHVFASLQHLWVAGAQLVNRNPPKISTSFSSQEMGELGMWLVPSLRTLRVRAARLFRPLPAGTQLDNLKEITLDTALLTSQGLIGLVSACKTLERFHFHSRGNSYVFSDKREDSHPSNPYLFEFTPEDIIPAFSHLKGTLRHLAINRWDGARGGADYSVNYVSGNKEMYATWPNWKGNGKLIGILKDFTVLETLKLDSTCLFHYSLGQIPPPLPTDHLTKRLPKSLRHLTLPGAPPQIIPALRALASASASNEFPALRLVEVTCDGRDVQKREISLRKYKYLVFPTDTYSKFISFEEWDSLEQEFAAAGVKLVHINSGNTACFARDVLVSAGLLEPVKESDSTVDILAEFP